MDRKVNIAHIFSNERYENRSYKFTEGLRQEGFNVMDILKPKEMSYPKFVFRSVKKVLSSDIDLVHCHRISGFIPGIIIKILNPKIKLIYDKHDIHKYDKIFDKFLFMADYVIVASDLHLKKISKHKKNVLAIYNYSPFKRINKEEIKKTRKEIGLKKQDIAILFQGSIVPEYGLEMLLSIAKRLPKEFKIIILGWIKNKEYWNKMKEKFDKRVIYIPPKEYLEMERYVSSCDIGVVLFDNSELTKYGNPNKLFEFFACKIPVIATNIESLNKYINNKNGIIVNNEEDLLKACLKLKEKKVRQKIAKNSPNLSWDTEIKKYLNLVNSLIKK